MRYLVNVIANLKSSISIYCICQSIFVQFPVSESSPCTFYDTCYNLDPTLRLDQWWVRTGCVVVYYIIKNINIPVYSYFPQGVTGLLSTLFILDCMSHKAVIKIQWKQVTHLQHVPLLHNCRFLNYACRNSITANKFHNQWVNVFYNTTINPLKRKRKNTYYLTLHLDFVNYPTILITCCRQNSHIIASFLRVHSRGKLQGLTAWTQPEGRRLMWMPWRQVL